MSLARAMLDHPGLATPRESAWRTALRSAASGLVGSTAIADAERQLSGPPRDPEARRQFLGNPWKYFDEILGWRLTNQQERALEEIEQRDRLLIAAANNVGKTWLLGGYAVYAMDVGATPPDDARDLAERGTMLLLPGPDHDTIKGSIWREILMHLRRALARGMGMPGEWSEKSVLWRVRPDWFAEAFSPQRKVGREVTHTASGRHGENMLAIIEEGQGVEEPVWRGAEGMCSGEGNKIVSAFNPTEPMGAAYARAQRGEYFVLHIDALGHPNVRERRTVVQSAISFRTIDRRVRADCVDRGALGQAQPDPQHHDFLYALPPANAEERGPRADGVPGHPDGAVRVYRPNGIFQGQVLGRWPDSSNTGLFDLVSLNAAIARWRAAPEPSTPPSRIGFDAAREGDDDSVLAPAWGDSAEALLRAYADARHEGEAALQELLATRRVRVGMMTVLQKGKGPEVAQQAAAIYPRSPWNVDEGGVGASVLDHAAAVMHIDAVGVSFSALAPTPTPGERWSENMRTALYLRAAMLVARGLVDVPDDPLLREELIAHRLLYKSRVFKVVDRWGQEVKERKPSVLLLSKDEVKSEIGRSPDRADAFVLALYAPPSAPTASFRVLTDDSDLVQPMQQAPNDDERIASTYPGAEDVDRQETCGGCANKGERNGRPWCTARRFGIRENDLACDRYEPARKG
ncbi:MAG: hypothetical protein SF182_01595 [Deltaproteobacteria bacterium]|nr:hypothetical protein [Deltaproteobacteria bacterium]